MLVLLSVIQGTLLLGAIGLLVYWAAVAYHVERTRTNLPTARQGLELPEAKVLAAEGGPPVCVVIPAHNEASVIGGLARSLKVQTYRPLRVVFALDRCTDSTRQVLEQEIAGDQRFEVIDVASWAEDWAGKVNAIWRGVKDSQGAKNASVFVFADADTVMDPDCIRATVAILQHRRLGMLSLVSTMTHEKWFENVVQPCAGMELMRQYPLERANLDRGRRPFANGQFILITREAYEKIGGHASVYWALLEDIEIARLCEKQGVRAGLFMAAGMHVCRMYTTFDEFKRGWKRIYIECANRRVSRLRSIGMRVLALGVGLPIMAVGTIAAGLVGFGLHPDELAWACVLVGAASIVVMLLSLGLAYRLGSVPVRHIFTYPIGAWHTGRILLQAAADLRAGVPTVWGGRTYVRPAR
jgi:cellulose synthase/poly-beta-1,6-N-acetylglucosamine synthase-like glycosyltransferase